MGVGVANPQCPQCGGKTAMVRVEGVEIAELAPGDSAVFVCQNRYCGVAKRFRLYKAGADVAAKEVMQSVTGYEIGNPDEAIKEGQ